MKWCGGCRGHAFGKCGCEAYQLWWPNGGETEDDARVLHGTSPETVAERWGETSDCESADYTIVGGQSEVVHIREPDGTVRAWRISGEACPVYHASQCDVEEP